MTQLVDPYKWWLDRRVDVLTPAWTWVRGQVIEAERSFLYRLGDAGDVPEFYESTYLGDSDGRLSVILFDGERRGEVLHQEIFPGHSWGIVPMVTPSARFAPELLNWWRELSPAAKTSLALDPGGVVPPEVIVEVAQKGALLSAAWWPETQSGPDGFRLSSAHAGLVDDVRLERAYVRAERHLQSLLPEVHTESAVEPHMATKDQIDAWNRRGATKRSLDVSRSSKGNGSGQPS